MAAIGRARNAQSKGEPAKDEQAGEPGRLKKSVYRAELFRLQAELVKLQE